MGSFLMTEEERDGGGGKCVCERSFACLESEDTWGIKDVRRSNTLILCVVGGEIR